MRELRGSSKEGPFARTFSDMPEKEKEKKKEKEGLPQRNKEGCFAVLRPCVICESHASDSKHTCIDTSRIAVFSGRIFLKALIILHFLIYKTQPTLFLHHDNDFHAPSEPYSKYMTFCVAKKRTTFPVSRLHTTAKHSYAMNRAESKVNRYDRW